MKEGKESNRINRLEKINIFLEAAVKEKVYDLKQLLKIARSHKFKLSADEQMEAITLRLKEKLKQCLVLNPLTDYFLTTDSENIKEDLIQAEISLADNNEGIGDHVEDELIERKRKKEKRERGREAEQG
jgi:hypothetical protein